jgi:catechol 2,3-dioxygenase-like lactoylglutathione lyase family enzyme
MSASREAGRARATGGVPTARRVDHVAFTVPDLDLAVGFLVDVLAGELVYRLPPLARDDDWMAEHLDVHPRASCEIAMVRLGPVTNVELFEYRAPDQNPVPPRPFDAGSHHLGLLVEDVGAAARHLDRQPGVRVLGEPRSVPAGAPHAGLRWVRLVAPWGMHLELRQVPEVLPYQRRTTARRFGPCPVWTNRADRTPAGAGRWGARNVDHLAYTVADLDAAERFFVDVLGAEPLYRTEPSDLSVDGLAAALGVPATGTVRHAALRMGPTDNVELYEYDVPGAGNRVPRNSDVGGRHLALSVEDVDAATAYLGAVPGTVVLGGPETIPDGPIGGVRWVYLRTSVGLYLELARVPDGRLPYERDTVARRCPSGTRTWSDR